MLLLITGGSGSGKSRYAEDRTVLMGKKRIYLATMYPYDEECRSRIKRHQDMRREKGFESVECYTGLAGIRIEPGADVLLECMSNLVANEMYREGGAGENTAKAVLEGIVCLQKRASNLIVVTNEVFSDGMEYNSQSQDYLSCLGKINKTMGRTADEVVEVVYGIPVLWKG